MDRQGQSSSRSIVTYASMRVRCITWGMYIIDRLGGKDDGEKVPARGWARGDLRAHHAGDGGGQHAAGRGGAVGPEAGENPPREVPSVEEHVPEGCEEIGGEAKGGVGRLRGHHGGDAREHACARFALQGVRRQAPGMDRMDGSLTPSRRQKPVKLNKAT
eukprot:644541-Prorocentrum_minimum.AAC.2